MSATTRESVWYELRVVANGADIEVWRKERRAIPGTQYSIIVFRAFFQGIVHD